MRFEGLGVRVRFRLYWAPVEGFSLSYHNKETTLFIIDPCYGSFNEIP